jgi:NAD(P)-dependent dehydrogenase (short-subunit alcohol dehydrogenase family)
MRTILVTGAAGGIGSAMCAVLHARGDRVIAACRSISPALAALSVRIERDIDLTHDEGVARLRQSLDGDRIDWLIHNAGLLSHEVLGEIDAGAALRIRRQFELNALAPLRLTEALLPNLEDGGKIGLISSRMGSIGDNASGGYYGYRMSKAALNAAGMSLAHDLRARKIAVAILHPGFVRTPMTRGRGDLEPAQAAANLVARMDALTLERSGTFWHANGTELPW